MALVNGQWQAVFIYCELYWHTYLASLMCSLSAAGHLIVSCQSSGGCWLCTWLCVCVGV